MDYKKIIVQWKEFSIPDALPRMVKINLDTEFILAITGPRRSGKTYLCFYLMKSLMKRVSKENILYINFEDEKLLQADAEDIDNLVNTYYELFNINNKQKIYLFLDEIQNVKNWDAWVRRIQETKKNIKLVLTGSSSKLLSKEISTKLRGRVINIEVFPLSFKELLEWRHISYNLKTIEHSKDRFKIKKLFTSYLRDGGYPAIVLNAEQKDTILQNYYESMIFKDVIERYKVKEIKKLKIIAKLLFESLSKYISYNKTANRLKSLGFDVSKNTIINYISYFEDAYLFFQNLRYEYSLTKQLGAIKKIYCIDNGLVNAVSFRFSDNVGRAFENLVYIELKRRKKEVYYHKSRYECDFIINDKNRIVDAIQVCYSLYDEKTRKRELRGLLEAMEKFKLKKGMIITEDESKIEKINKKEIVYVPLWKWLLY